MTTLEVIIEALWFYARYGPRTEADAALVAARDLEHQSAGAGRLMITDDRR